MGNVSNRYSQTMVTVALPRVAEGGEHGLLLGGGEVAEAPHHAAQGVGHPDQGAVVQGQTVQAVEFFRRTFTLYRYGCECLFHAQFKQSVI